MTGELCNPVVYSYRLFFDGSDIWFVQQNMSILFRVDLNREKVYSYVIPILFELVDMDSLYTKIVFSDNHVYLIPLKAKYIICFNKESEDFEIIKTNTDEVNSFSDAFRYEDGIILIPYMDKWVKRFDLHTKQLKPIDRLDNYGKWNYGTFSCDDENCIYIPSGGSTDILYYDLTKKSFEKICMKVGSYPNCEPYIVIRNGYAFVVLNAAEDCYFMKVSLKTGEIVNKVKVFEKETDHYALLNRVSGDFIILDYAFERKFEIYDEELNCIFCKQREVNGEYQLIPDYSFGGSTELDSDRFAYLESISGMMYVYRINDGKVVLENTIHISMDDLILESLKKEWISKCRVPINESLLIGLRELVDCV